jgi:hypothetical protein
MQNLQAGMPLLVQVVLTNFGVPGGGAKAAGSKADISFSQAAPKRKMGINTKRSLYIVQKIE